MGSSPSCPLCSSVAFGLFFCFRSWGVDWATMLQEGLILNLKAALPSLPPPLLSPPLPSLFLSPSVVMGVLFLVSLSHLWESNNNFLIWRQSEGQHSKVQWWRFLVWSFAKCVCGECCTKMKMTPPIGNKLKMRGMQLKKEKERKTKNGGVEGEQSKWNWCESKQKVFVEKTSFHFLHLPLPPQPTQTLTSENWKLFFFFFLFGVGSHVHALCFFCLFPQFTQREHYLLVWCCCCCSKIKFVDAGWINFLFSFGHKFKIWPLPHNQLLQSKRRRKPTHSNSNKNKKIKKNDKNMFHFISFQIVDCQLALIVIVVRWNRNSCFSFQNIIYKLTKLRNCFKQCVDWFFALFSKMPQRCPEKRKKKFENSLRWAGRTKLKSEGGRTMFVGCWLTRRRLRFLEKKKKKKKIGGYEPTLFETTTEEI